MILIRLEGEPANGPIARAHSLALGAVLAETDVVEIASSNGDTATLPFIGIDAGVAGFSSGDCARGESKGGDASLAVLPLLYHSQHRIQSYRQIKSSPQTTNKPTNQTTNHLTTTGIE